jgi:S1-C subfamily serine protease
MADPGDFPTLKVHEITRGGISMKRIALVLLVSLSLAVAGLPASAQTPSYLEAKGALALVETGAGTGSGFVIGAGLLATACHVVRGAASIQIHYAAVQAHTAGRQVLCDERLDIAFIAAAVPDGVTTLHLAADPPSQGDRIYVWGYPLGTLIALEPSVAAGVVSATQTAAGFLALDVSAAPGNSGGPVVDERGEVVGILVGSWSAGSQGSTGFKYAAPATNVTKLVQGLDPDAIAPLSAEVQEETTMVRPAVGLGALKLGMTPAQAETAIGLPPSERNARGWADWNTRRISVLFARGAAVAIYTEDPAAATAEGIRLGSNDVDLIKAYGSPECSRLLPVSSGATLGWVYHGLVLFITGTPRHIVALLVVPGDFATAVCH